MGQRPKGNCKAALTADTSTTRAPENTPEETKEKKRTTTRVRARARAQETFDENTKCKIQSEKRPVGHPPCYTPEIAAEVCRRLAAGEYLKNICESDGMPSHTTVNMWVVEDHEGFFALYMRARRAAALAMAEQCHEIADASGLDVTVGDDGKLRVDGEVVRRAELRIKTRQWTMERVYQKVFGAKMDFTSDNKPLFGAGARDTVKSLIPRLREIEAQLAEMDGGGK